MINKAIILCGGMGTRFLPITKSVPKEMLPIVDKPVLQYLMEDLNKANIKEVLILNGRNKECVIRHFDKYYELEKFLEDRKKFDLLEKVQYPNNLADIYFKNLPEAKGTGYCVEKAKNWIGNEPFLILYGDEVVFSRNQNVIEQLIDCYEKYKTNIIAVQEVPKKDVNRYGIISITEQKDNEYFIDDIVEKPAIEHAPSNVSYIGPAILTHEIFDAIEKLPKKENEEIVLTNAFRFLAKENKIVACKIEGKRQDLGNKLGFIKANIVAGLQDDEIKKDLKQYIINLSKELN